MNNLLVDTNVLIYAIDADSAFYAASRKIIENPKYRLLTTSKNLVEFIVVTTKQDSDDRYA